MIHCVCRTRFNLILQCTKTLWHSASSCDWLKARAVRADPGEKMKFVRLILVLLSGGQSELQTRVTFFSVRVKKNLKLILNVHVTTFLTCQPRLPFSTIYSVSCLTRFMVMRQHFGYLPMSNGPFISGTTSLKTPNSRILADNNLYSKSVQNLRMTRWETKSTEMFDVSKAAQVLLSCSLIWNELWLKLWIFNYFLQVFVISFRCQLVYNAILSSICLAFYSYVQKLQVKISHVLKGLKIKCTRQIISDAKRIQ